MSTKTKLIRTIYLYLAALVSLIFVAVGTGNLLSTTLKYYVFPKAEKSGFNRCNEQPPVYGFEKGAFTGVPTEDQKAQLQNMLNEYDRWKENNKGEDCYSQERQNNAVNALVMIFVALPILYVHWRIIKKERAEKE